MEESIRAMFVVGLMATVPCYLTATFAAARLSRLHDRRSRSAVVGSNSLLLSAFVLWICAASTLVAWVLARPRYHVTQVTYGMSFPGPLSLLFPYDRPSGVRVLAGLAFAVFLTACFVFFVRTTVRRNVHGGDNSMAVSLPRQLVAYWFALSIPAWTGLLVDALAALLTVAAFMLFEGIRSVLPDLPGVQLLSYLRALPPLAAVLLPLAWLVVFAYSLSLFVPATALAIHYPSGVAEEAE